MKNKRGGVLERQDQFKHRDFLFEISRSEINQVFRLLGSQPQGLDVCQVEHMRKTFGTNSVAHENLRWRSQLKHLLLNPFNILLGVLASVSFATDDVKGGITLTAMVILSVTLTFFQEFRSSRAAEKLKKMVQTRATILRLTSEPHARVGATYASQRQDILIEEIVPGDVLLLSAGDMVPADVRLIHSKHLFLSQSSMTGESVPVEKFSEPEAVSQTQVFELKNICFMGTNVVSGSATAIVLKTGANTFFGSIAKSVVGQRQPTSFDKGVQRFTWLMLKFMMVMVPLVFVVNGLMKGNWMEAFMFAIAIAVGLTPEMLPMIVTVNLAKGALAMSKKKVIVKRLNSIQNFGAMNVLCTDKTGTLTQDRIVLDRYLDVSGNVNNRVLKYGYLNSYYQTGLKNLLDRAILDRNELTKDLDVENVYRKLDEIPFDFNRKRMSVVVEKVKQRHILICKGALEEIFKVCTHAEVGAEVVLLDDTQVERFQKTAQDMNDEGLRVIAVAYKDLKSDRKTEYGVFDESDLTLIGYIAFLDPPKESAALAIQKLLQLGIAVKVLTGDNDRVTRKVAKDVGLSISGLILGSELEELSDEDFDRVVETSSVFAKLSPAQKEKIIHSLHRGGHVVGFMGDGINDAPALRAADVGISVDNAVDIAKESADMILLEKSLLVLEEGILEGRKVFGNIIKYIKMGASSNFGNMFSMLGASALLPFLPMQPVQVLTQNLLYDVSQTAIPFDDVDAEYLKKPRRWEIGEIGRFMVVFGPVSSIFDYVLFAVMWFVYRAQSVDSQALFQTGWFVEGLLSQTLIVHMIRTRKIPFIQSRASWPLLGMTFGIMAVGIYVPFTLYGQSIGLIPLPQNYFFWLFGILISYCVLTQFVKNQYIKRYGFN